MRIGIIAAMEDELRMLRNQMEDRAEHQYGKIEFYSGKLGGHEVGMLLCGIGKVNAAVGTTLLAEKFKPEYIINTGVAGGITADLAVGDIVLSTEVRHHDADATVFDYEYGQIPRMPVAYKADETLIQLAYEAANKHDPARIIKGMIMSGDSFIYHPSQVRVIRERFPAVLAVEMEGAAVAQTCYLFGIPFLIIRSISDQVTGERNEMEYAQFVLKAAETSAGLVINLLRRMREIGVRG